MRRAARIRLTPRVRTAAAINAAPMYARFINPFGSFDAEYMSVHKRGVLGEQPRYSFRSSDFWILNVIDALVLDVTVRTLVASER